MTLLLGGVPTDAGAGPFTHTWSTSAQIANTLTSFTVQNGINLATDAVYEYLGCVVNSATISANVGEVVTASLDCKYANETKTTSGIDTTPAADTFADPFAFQYGSIQLPSGTTLAEVQSFEFTGGNDVQLVHGLGSRFATKNVAQKRTLDFKMNLAFQDASEVNELFYGQATGPLAGNPAETATLILTFDNGLATTANRKWLFTFADIQIDEDSLPQSSNEIIFEDVGMYAKSLTSLVYTDNTSSAPTS